MLLRLDDLFWSWRFIWAILIKLNYELKLYDSAFLRNFAGSKGDILLDHTDTIQKLLNKKEMKVVLENNEITLRRLWDVQIHMEMSEKIWGRFSSFSFWGSQRYLT